MTCIAPAIVSGQTASPVSIKIIAPKTDDTGRIAGRCGRNGEFDDV